MKGSIKKQIKRLPAAAFILSAVFQLLFPVTAYCADPTYTFTSKNGSFTVVTDNTANGAKQTHTVKVTVDKKTNMKKNSQDAAYSVTSSGNWKNISFSATKAVMGAVSESGEQSEARYVLYNNITVPKPRGYIISSVDMANYYGSNIDRCGVGSSLRWSYSNNGVGYDAVAKNKRFNMKNLNRYAPVVGKDDRRFHNTFEEDADLKMVIVATCRSAGLRLDSQKNEVKNMTITMHYTPATYTVQYNSAGGSGCQSTVALYDQVFALPQTSRKGYTFTGWNGAGLTAKTGNVANLTATDKSVLNLTAGWRANTYTVSYDTAGGNAITDMTATYDSAFQLPGCSKTGYVFTGWNGAGLTNRVGSVSNLTDVNGGKIRLTAGWRPVRYRIVFLENGGSKCDPVEMNYDKEVTLPEPVREGYVFLGWSGGGLVQKKGTVKNLSIHDNTQVELTAEWVAEDDPEMEELKKKIDQVMEKQDQPRTKNEYYNTYGLTAEEAKAWLDALVSGQEVQLKIDGVKYSLIKNEDGSITIKLSDMGNAEKLIIPNEITIGDITYPITAIDRECFKNNVILREITMGEHILRIEDGAFEGCTKLEKVVLNEDLTHIGERAFFHCESLRDIALPEGVQTIGKEAFAGCSSLAGLRLNEGLLSVGDKAFYGCCNIKELYIGKSLLKIGTQAFSRCTSLKRVSHAPEAELLKMGKKTFAGDTALTTVELPDKLTSVSARAFSKCFALSSVKGGKGILKVGDNAFEDCKKLRKITLSSGLQKIGKKAFYNCRSLAKVSIKSKSLTKVGKDAFVRCKKNIRFSVPKSKSASYSKLMKGKY
ncbi:MAG: leucine-rich repeat protein [Lachnospiraceae bacterium]|nr:leucine-rich repeat protein [Lachnospiraceae bacterium]